MYSILYNQICPVIYNQQHMVKRCPKVTPKSPRPIIGRTKGKRPTRSKNLISQLKTQLNALAKQIPDLPKDLKLRLKNKVNMITIKACFQNQDFNCLLKQKIKSGEFLKMIYKSRKQSRNLCNFLIYYNKIINAVYNPNIMGTGFWSSKTTYETSVGQENYGQGEGKMDNEGEPNNAVTETEVAALSDGEQEKSEHDNMEEQDEDRFGDDNKKKQIETMEELKQAGV